MERRKGYAKNNRGIIFFKMLIKYSSKPLAGFDLSTFHSTEVTKRMGVQLLFSCHLTFLVVKSMTKKSKNSFYIRSTLMFMLDFFQITHFNASIEFLIPNQRFSTRINPFKIFVFDNSCSTRTNIAGLGQKLQLGQNRV